jgi:hypothetical protein
MYHFKVTMRVDTPLTEPELRKWIEGTVPWEWNLFDYATEPEEF